MVFAAGIRPRAQLARDARLQCNRGVIVSDVMQTFDPRIYAVGECAEHRGVAYGLVAPLFEQASVCANHLACLGYSSYQGSRLSTRLKVTGIEVFSTGEFGRDANHEDVVLHDPDAMVYQRAVIRDGVLVGAVMVGDTSTASWLTRLVHQKADVGALRQHLLFGETRVSQACSTKSTCPYCGVGCGVSDRTRQQAGHRGCAAIRTIPPISASSAPRARRCI